MRQKIDRYIGILLGKVKRRKYLLWIHYATQERRKPEWFDRLVVKPTHRHTSLRLTVKTRLPTERFHVLPDSANFKERRKSRIDKYGKESTFDL